MPGPNLGLGTPPVSAWWPAGARFAADFVNDRYMRGGANIAAASAYTLVRASAKYAEDSAASWRVFGPNMLARTDRGALIEPAAQNLIANSSFVGAQLSATDMLDGLPTGWDLSKIDGIGVKARIVAIGPWLGLPSITVRLWGSSTVSDAELRGFVWSNLPSNVAAVQGDIFAQNLIIQRVGGSNTNFVSRLRLVERNNAGTYLQHHSIPFTPSALPQRVSSSTTLGSATTARVLGGLEFALSGSFDITLRIAAAQFIKTNRTVPTSPILTTTATASRTADSLTLHLGGGSQTMTAIFDDGSTQSIASTGGDTLIDPAALQRPGLVRIHAGP